MFQVSILHSSFMYLISNCRENVTDLCHRNYTMHTPYASKRSSIKSPLVNYKIDQNTFRLVGYHPLGCRLNNFSRTGFSLVSLNQNVVQYTNVSHK